MAWTINNGIKGEKGDPGQNGNGTVNSVNSVLPDVNGNVELEIASSWNDLTDKPTEFNPIEHPISKVTGLQTALDEASTHSRNINNPHSVTKSQVGLADVDNAKQLPIAGGTLTGITVGQANTSYTVAQLRNVILSTASPSGGNNGDIWIKYV